MFSRRYLAMWAAVLVTLATFAAAALHHLSWLCAIVPALLVVLGLYDMRQNRHAILRNYPIWGHLRFFFEFVRPEIRQYFVEDDTDEKPFSLAQRSLVYQRAKNAVDSRPYGTELDVKAVGHEWISHSLAPTKLSSCDFRVLVGADRAQPYSMSIFNVSAMSFGALSANAIRALNLGAKKGGFAHDTGEGSMSKYHREHGGDIIWEVASGYFGCRNDDGTFNAEKFQRQAAEPQVKMIEVKLSQGAKPGHGGVLLAAKVTPEIAETRGVPMGQDCISPARHSEFSTPRGLLEFVERLRKLSGGKPTGFKLCIGHPWEFFGIAKAMLETGILPDFIVVDGAEGGTGAAPLEFTDHIGTPLQEGLLLVHNTLVGIGLREKIRIGASGKIITAFDIAKTLAIGADWVNSARGFMFAVGCIQAQKCHSDRCPTGVATQDPVRQRALNVPDKGERVFNFHHNTLHALQEIIQAAGIASPDDLRAHHIVRRVSSYEVKLMSDLLKYLKPGDLLEGRYRYQLYEKWWPVARSDSFAPAEG
ncbi:FMN-binding glutamate synthase family protein [Paraburkholderia dinghuensis]|uniref:FMN-binding glutamate synthase family protein n=1 Tax=Paraburkholderia dinghuensis TaxID=2305225 RepID=A0A3N6PNE6_9BURK|nr:FMN-binding glutamate synthase family protein [Paraburkholderia dinghuensis]RQH00646.1 FMN-binding glutamate synthase family protein [Paraburkholderia dinghuensis]